MRKAGLGGGERDTHISKIPLWSEEDIYRLCIKPRSVQPHQPRTYCHHTNPHFSHFLTPKHTIIKKRTRKEHLISMGIFSAPLMIAVYPCIGIPILTSHISKREHGTVSFEVFLLPPNSFHSKMMQK